MRIISLIIPLWISFFSSYSQNFFEKNYGTIYYDEPYSMIEETNGDIVMAGRANSWTSAFILKTNSSGDSLWMKYYKPDTIQYSYSMFNQILKFSNNYLAAGYYSNLSNYDVYLVKTDLNGDTLFTKLYETLNLKEQCMDILVDDSSNLYFLNYVNQTGNFYYYVQLMKTDSTGNVTLIKDYLNMDFNTPFKIIKAENENLLMLCSKSYTFGSTLYFFPIIVKIDDTGDTLWTKSFENCGGGYKRWDMIYDDNKIFLLINPVTGYDSLNISNTDVRLYTLDSTGNIINTWNYHWDNKSLPMSINKSNDGFLISGYALEQAQSVLTKLDIIGGTVWTCTQPKTYLSSILETSDGKITVSGSTDRQGFSYNNSRDIYLSKVDSTCIVGITENVILNVLNVYPNPAIEKLNIHFNLASPSNGTIQISNLVGQSIMLKKIDKVFDSSTQTIDINSLSPGVYFLNIKFGDQIETKKFVKLKNW